MKWTSLLKGFTDKVGFSHSPLNDDASFSAQDEILPPLAEETPASSSGRKEKHELEMELKTHWELFRSSSSEKVKELALNVAVDAFCRLAWQQTNATQLDTELVEAYVFSFVVGRAFVTDIQKLEGSVKTRSFTTRKILGFLMKATEDCLCPGSNLLHAVEVLVSLPKEKQPLLDSGILSCLIHILNALLTLEEPNSIHSEDNLDTPILLIRDNNYNEASDGPHLEEKNVTEVEESIVHIMKALATHPSSARCLAEDDSLQLLFKIVAKGSLTVISKFEDSIPLHIIQLYRHALQILGLLLENDDGSTAKYVRKHHLVKVLLMALKNFKTEIGDPAYTVGIVDLLLQCVELSFRTESGIINLREDIHNAHGYQFIVQFALLLSTSQKNLTTTSIHPVSFSDQPGANISPNDICPSLSRLLDILVNLSQTGINKSTGFVNGKFSKLLNDHEAIERDALMVKDLEAIQMLQDIFLKTDSVDVKAEILNRMLKIFTCHMENYKLCQELKTVSLFILNMSTFPQSLQEMILKIVEYAVTVLNCTPEQELLSLCFLLQQPIPSELKHVVLSFFLKLLSFDQNYKKVMQEIGVLESLLDDLKLNKILYGVESLDKGHVLLERKTNSCSFKKRMNTENAILFSTKSLVRPSTNLSLFEDEVTTGIAWDCLLRLLQKSENNQSLFRSSNGVITILPLLTSDMLRPGVLRTLSCLITEDVSQAHPEELGALIDVLKSGMVTNTAGSQLDLHYPAKCDILEMLWHILCSNYVAKKVFGDSSGFSLLLTTLHSFQKNSDYDDEENKLMVHMRVLSFLLRMVTASVCRNSMNRVKLYAIISSQSFFELLTMSDLLSANYENQFIQLFLELALEIIMPPSYDSKEKYFLTSHNIAIKSTRVYNGGAIIILIRSLLLFTPVVQLDVLSFIEKLACCGSFNQERLTSVGCVGLLLEIIQPFLFSPSPLLPHVLKIVEVLGAYRLTSSELRTLARYILKMKPIHPGHMLVSMMERLLQAQDPSLDNVPLANFLEMNMSKVGHASLQVSLGERTWPPVSGYSFVCWFQFFNFMRKPASIPQQESCNFPIQTNSSKQLSPRNVFRIVSVGAVNENILYVELYLDDDGNLTLTSGNSSLSVRDSEIEEGKWHHLAIIHSKPNALAGLFHPSVACVYLNGKLKHTGKLGYLASPVGQQLQVTIGNPIDCAKISESLWRFRRSYLFEETLAPGNICFMFLLGRGYRGLFQDTDLLHFVPNQACSMESLSILQSLNSESTVVSNRQKAGKHPKPENGAIVWDMEKLRNFSLELSAKKIIFAFDGTTDVSQATGVITVINLVDVLSSAASPFGGIPRIGRLHGDIYVCCPELIGDTLQMVGGVAFVLALLETSETRNMLHMTLKLLACTLNQNPENVNRMQACRGYHLLALFIHQRMSLFDMQCLEILFQIATCKTFSPLGIDNQTFFEDLSFSKFSEEIALVGSNDDLDDASMQRDSPSQTLETENIGLKEKITHSIVLSNADVVEHVLLDWTVWVTAPISLQLGILEFLERLVSLHWCRNHNLMVLDRINLIQHLLVTLQRGDVEVPVLEKLVVLLGVILEHKFKESELKYVVKFVIMTFDPPDLASRHEISRELMGKHVIVRNMLLEMLIDLQMTIGSDDLLEQWHKIVSSKLITYFLDESLHPTSMKWVMTLLGISLSSSPTFALKFRNGGGYQGLSRVLSSFYDSPEIYYILFCLIFGKSVYPRLPEVCLLDFHALIPDEGKYGELEFVELLESVVAMVKSTFDRLSMKAILTCQKISLSEISSFEAEFGDDRMDAEVDLQGEALMHKTYAARLLSGESAAPSGATSVLRFMIDLAKKCPSFSAICQTTKFLERCVDLYFSCVRSFFAIKMAKELHLSLTSEKNSLGNENCHKPGLDDDLSMQNFLFKDKSECQRPTSHLSSVHLLVEDGQISLDSDAFAFERISDTISHVSEKQIHEHRDSPNCASLEIKTSPVCFEKSDRQLFSPSSAPINSLASWTNSIITNHDSMSQLVSTPSMESVISTNEFDEINEFKSPIQGSFPNGFFNINPKLLLDVDNSGYGGGPSSASATSILEFIAKILADLVVEQAKVVPFIDVVLQSVPLFVNTDTALIFQGLCLGRLMNFLERKLLRSKEENGKKNEKGCWSANLDALCWIIVDRVYMGTFPHPNGVIRVLEFLLSMLQFVNEDGHVLQEVTTSGNRFFSITRGSRPLETYIHTLLKNTNRMIMYCFLPSFLITIREDDFLSRIALLEGEKPKPTFSLCDDETRVDIYTVLQILSAHKQLIFCPNNMDKDLMCCMCVNLSALLCDRRQNVQSLSVEILKYLLLHRRVALEELLVLRTVHGHHLDVLHGGFDKLLTEGSSFFFKWFQVCEHIVHKVLELSASVLWTQYITDSTKFPSEKTKDVEIRRKREMGKKSREALQLDFKHLEQINERRCTLELIHDVMATDLRVVRQDKYGWILHAESEWHVQLQQLVHERGVFPIPVSLLLDWKLCPIEGPYRMRKRLERSVLKINSIRDKLIVDCNRLEIANQIVGGINQCFNDAFEIEFRSFFPFMGSTKQKGSNDGDYLESNHMDSFEDDHFSTPYEMSVSSTVEIGGKSGSFSIQVTDSITEKSNPGSISQSSSLKIDQKIVDNKTNEELIDNGEYLIRPYLEPGEKIRFQYNCERVLGLDKHDGIFLIGDLCLYVIENFFIDKSGYICEKKYQDELSVIDQALGINRNVIGSSESILKQPFGETTGKICMGGRAWAYNGGAWGKEKIAVTGDIPHPWCMWKIDHIREILKRDYQLRPVAVEIFSIDGCNDLLVFHKNEREDVFKNLLSVNLPRNTMLDSSVSGSVKQDTEGNRIFKIMAKSFSKLWQNGEISNFQYLMHLNTLAGRGFSDLTQYPVFPWILADYESETLDLSNPKTFRKLEKSMGCQTLEGEVEFRKRYDNWDDPYVPRFHYGSHYSSAGIVLFYLVRLPPFSAENQKLQGGQFDHADRLFNSIKDTWLSASGKGNTSDVKELIPEFFYMPEFLENRCNLDLGEKQSGEKVGDVILPPWAKGSSREFIQKHREALESVYVSENLNHWIDLIFGYKQRGKAAEEAVNVFYHYTYEGNVDIDTVSDPSMKLSILSQINHFGQTPRQLFLKPHVKRQVKVKIPRHPLKHANYLIPQEIRKTSNSISQIVIYNDNIIVAKRNSLLKPQTYNKYISWGFPDCSLRFLSRDQDKLLSTHENLLGGNQIQSVAINNDGHILVTAGEDGILSVWRIKMDKVHSQRHLRLERSLYAHTSKVTCLQVCQPYMLIVSGSDDHTVILWDLSSLAFVRQLHEFPSPISAIHMNDLTGEIMTAAGTLLSIWNVNGDCLGSINTSQLPSDVILSITSSTFSDWLETNWYVTGHQSGAIKIWKMVHLSEEKPEENHLDSTVKEGFPLKGKMPEYRLILRKVLKWHKRPVTALHLTSDLKKLLSGDSAGHLLSWTLADGNIKSSFNKG